MWCIFLLVSCLALGVRGHGRMHEPPGRSTMWRHGFDNPVNNNDHELNCGGFSHQHEEMNGLCGLCGDPFDQSPRENEAGGTYANGIIGSEYTAGQVVDLIIEITAQHKGWHEFRLCVNDDPSTPITQECLDENLLELADGSGTRWYWQQGDGKGEFIVPVLLPTGVTCSQCVVQWKWNTGNRWGTDPDGTACTGCGPQEQFYACGDVSIN